MARSTPVGSEADAPEAADGTAGGEPIMPLREFFDLLAAPHRRYAIYYLRRIDGVAEIRNLVEHAAAWEAGTTPDELPPERYEEVYVRFVRTHLPALRDAGIVEYDLRSERVAFTGAAIDLFGRFGIDDAR